MMIAESIKAFLQGVLTFFVTIYSTMNITFGEEGHSSDMWTASFITYITVVLASNIVVFWRSYQITLFLTLVFIIFSIMPFFWFAMLYDSPFLEVINECQGTYGFLINQRQFILVIFLNVCFIALVEGLYEIMKVELAPMVTDYFMY